MSPRVSTPSPLSSACSGDMYSSVPTIVPYWVNIVHSVSFCSVALATPKSITLGTVVFHLLHAERESLLDLLHDIADRCLVGRFVQFHLDLDLVFDLDAA